MMTINNAYEYYLKERELISGSCKVNIKEKFILNIIDEYHCQFIEEIVEDSYKMHDPNNDLSIFKGTTKLSYQTRFGRIKEGPFKVFSIDEKLYAEADFINGKLNGILKYYYLNNIVSSEEEYKDDKRNGMYKKYRSDGTLFYTCHYKDNNKDGEEIHWNRNGQMSVLINYKNGKRNGEYKEFTYDGSLQFIRMYANDVEIRE